MSSTQPLLANPIVNGEIYIAPVAGERYHLNAQCVGLRHARRVQRRTLCSLCG